MYIIKAVDRWLCQPSGNESVDGWLSQSLDSKMVR